MNKELPFELYKYHKKWTKFSWKKQGMIFNNEEFKYWYNEYIYETHCRLDKCKKPFKSSRDRQLDHNHKTGEIRDIICRKCNQKKKDKKTRKDNTSGYNGINKHIDKCCKQGFIWMFQANINGKRKCIKKSIDYDYLVEFAENWKKENNYYT